MGGTTPLWSWMGIGMRTYLHPSDSLPEGKLAPSIDLKSASSTLGTHG